MEREEGGKDDGELPVIDLRLGNGRPTWVPLGGSEHCDCRTATDAGAAASIAFLPSTPIPPPRPPLSFSSFVGAKD